MICTVALAASQALLMIIPAEINYVSSVSDSSTAITNPWINILYVFNWNVRFETLYYLIFATNLFMLAIALPFVYFYLDDEDSDHENESQGPLIKTCLSVACLFVLFIFGGFITPSNPMNIQYPWFLSLMNQTNFETAFNFLIGTITLISMLIQITLVSFGLTSFPFGILKGNELLIETKDADNSGRLNRLGLMIKDLESKKNLTSKEERSLEKLKNDEKSTEH